MIKTEGKAHASKKCGAKTRADKLLEDNIGGNYDGITEEELSKLIKKHKINNKQIQLSISSELKKIASLSTIIQLREL